MLQELYQLSAHLWMLHRSLHNACMPMTPGCAKVCTQHTWQITHRVNNAAGNSVLKVTQAQALLHHPTVCVHACRYKWDTLPAAQRPERGLLGLRAGLNAFANLRPAIVPPQVSHTL